MKTLVNITNQELYNEKIIDVDTEGMNGLTGTISIETEENGWVDFTGEHGENDYKEDFGFVLVPSTGGYLIADSTANTGAIYIDADGTNCHLEEQARVFETEEKARETIENNGWQDWACVLPTDYPANC